MFLLPESIKRIRLKTKKRWKHLFPHYKYIGVFYRCSMADNSILCGPIWSIFEFDILHVFNTYKFKMDQVNSNPRKNGNINFFAVPNSVFHGQIWPYFKLVQALMYVIITCKYEKDLIKNS